MICSVSYASVGDVDRAVAAAKEAYDNGPWGKMNPRDRGSLLYRYVAPPGGQQREEDREKARDNVQRAQMLSAKNWNSLGYLRTIPYFLDRKAQTKQNSQISHTLYNSFTITLNVVQL